MCATCTCDKSRYIHYLYTICRKGKTQRERVILSEQESSENVQKQLLHRDLNSLIFFFFFTFSLKGCSFYFQISTEILRASSSTLVLSVFSCFLNFHVCFICCCCCCIIPFAVRNQWTLLGLRVHKRVIEVKLVLAEVGIVFRKPVNPV